MEMAALNIVHADGEYWELWRGDGLNTQITAAVANAWEEARKLGYDAYKQKLIAKATSLRHFRRTILAVAAWIVLISGG